ncbi:MAG: discoidin domain-containing protein [Streptosporangiaceae bacterium]
MHPRRARATAVAAAITLLATSWLILPQPASAGGGPNLALNKAATASSSNSPYAAGNVDDGNQATYWESSGTTLPQWAQVDLGSVTSVDQVVLRVPSGWGARTQTLSVQGSTNGSSFSNLVASAGYSFDPASGNVVTVNFDAASTRFVRVNVTANTGWASAQLSELEVHGTSGSASPNLAEGGTFSASSAGLPAAGAGDGDQGSYWESANGVFPQWLMVDLGAAKVVGKVVLRVPSGWETRTQTLSVQGSSDSSSFSDLVGSAGYGFNPAVGNVVTVSFAAVTTRYVRLVITANSGWPAGQISELEVYGPGGTQVDTTPPTAPGGLAFTEVVPGQVRLTWSASMDAVGVSGYEVFANGVLRTTVAGNVLTYTDTQPTSATVTYYVRARDAATNTSPAGNTVTRQGNTTDQTPPTAPGSLAYTQPTSGQIKLTWSASTDAVGVSGYEVYANGVLRTTVAGNVLTYTDSQPDTATVAYYVRARDAAGNLSAAGNTVTRNGTTGGTNLATGKMITASGSIFTFVPTNANDGSLTTYWEGSGNPSTLTVDLRAKANVSSVVLKLNPDSAWGARAQNIEVLSREGGSGNFTQLAAAATYNFNPGSGNTVTIPVSGLLSQVQLKINSNTGAPAGQIAEFQVIGTLAPAPDLTVTDLTWTPAAPTETDALTLKATVRNTGTASSAASNVNFYLGSTKVGTGPVGALAAGASAVVNLNLAARDAGSYPVSAKVDESDQLIELNELNNSYASPNDLVVGQVASSDLIASGLSWSPGNPAAGDTTAFSVAIRNQGTTASASGAHGISLQILDAGSTVVKTLTGSVNGTLAPGATSAPVNLGTWTAANGKYTVKVVLADDANELPVKRTNNTSNQPFFVGRGANLPFDMYEAEDGVLAGGASVVGPNRTIGDLAGEASGRKAVKLYTTGSSVEFTTRAATNTLVTRFSVPDGTTSNLNIYLNGTFLKAIDLTSRYSWMYGDEASPNNSPGPNPRHIYDEANIMLGTTVPAGAKIKLQKDAANSSTYAIDFVNTELATAIPNPDPAHYTVPAGFTQQDVQAALDRVRQNADLVGVYLPPGDYATANKFQVYGKATKVVGAGPWFTRFSTPQTQDGTDAGFDANATANGSTFSGFGFFGNYTSRIDGPGKVFNFSGVSNMTVDNIWVEHMICMFWATDVTNSTVKNSRIRDTWADGVNLTNGSSNNTITNIETRTSGDDSFALFPATDHSSRQETGNVFANLTSLLTWRAAGLAVYGGADNHFRNIYIADTLTYSGVTVGTLKFGGIPALGFESTPQTTFENISLVRDGGHFWGQQVFPALWIYSAEYPFRGLRFSDIDIVDPTYVGIMFQTKYSGSTPLMPITDTVFTNVSVSGAHRSGDAFDAKSGFGLWANPLPEAGQGPPVGSVTFNNLRLTDNVVDIQNTTPFTIIRNS